MAPQAQPVSTHRVYRYRGAGKHDARVTREGTAFRVTGSGVERTVAMTDLDNDEALRRLQRRLRAAGIDDALAAAGCVDGDTVRIGDAEFVYASEAAHDE